MVLTGLEAMPGQPAPAKVRTTKETEMKGLTGIGLSAAALIAGAIMYYAVTSLGSGFSVS